MDRRTFISTVASGVVVTPFIGEAQQPSLPLVGYLSSRSPEESAAHSAAFRRGLGDIGYVEGQTVAIEYRWAKGDYERLAALAGDLARLGVRVLVAVGGAPSALAAKAATPTIPIVFLIGDDPAKIGLVASLNRPGRNITGVTFVTTELGAKRLALLYELVPNAGVSAFLINPKNPEAGSQAQDMEAAARSLGRRLLLLHASTEGRSH